MAIIYYSESQVWDRSERQRSALPPQPLTGSDLHIWCASLNDSPEELAHHFSLLSLDEKARAERFYFERDRNRFIMGRGFLRSILGNYLEIEPAQIEFVYSQYGKPSLKIRGHEKALEFNLSHSKDIALYAVGRNRRIGIDVEHVHPMPNMDKFAEEFFSPSENAFINSLSGKQKEETFFKIWTCKEAFLKANGNGLTMLINQVEISLKPDASAVLISVDNDKEQVKNWHLELLNPALDYQAALAVNGCGGQIILRQLKQTF